jgi:hypothetical protein
MSVFLLDNFRHYLQVQASRPENGRAVRPLAITLSREAGAGAVTVAELVRQRLTAAETEPSSSPWAVFDANLAKQVLKDQLPTDLARFMAEDARLPVEAIVEEILGLHPSGWTLVQHTTHTILRLGGLGRSIVVGRGGNIITARLPNVFHVRLVAPLVKRVRHSAEYYHLDEAEAAKSVREQDQARRRYFNEEIDEPTLYDVTLNTGRMGFARAAEVIAEAGLRHHQEFAGREGSLKVPVE